MYKVASFCITLLVGVFFISSISYASLTKEQSDDVAEFITTFIKKGNERRDENGYPLLVYALSNDGNTCIEIRRSGYYGELYYIKNNNYHMKDGKYIELGQKWCMDCGDFIDFIYNRAFDLDLINHTNNDPWHIKDMYADAMKYENSRFFEFVYKDVPIYSIDEANLQKGDIILKIGSKENHGLIYIGNGMQAAHASRNGIKYRLNPPILGFEVVQLNKFYKTSTAVSVIRVKDDIIPVGKVINSAIIWPDTMDEEVLVLKQNMKMLAYELIDVEIHFIEEFEDKEFVMDYSLKEINIEDEQCINTGFIYWISEDIKKLLINLRENFIGVA